MPDEFGDLIPEDLNDLRMQIEDEIEVLMDNIRKMHRAKILGSWLRAQVLEHAEADSSDELSYGIGAVKLRIPRIDIEDHNGVWARPRRQMGQFRMPPIESWVHVTFLEGSPEHGYYDCAEFHDGPMVWSRGEDNEEAIGFTPPDLIPFAPGKLPSVNVGKHLRDARTSPDKIKILESDATFAFIKDDTLSMLRMMVDALYEIQITAGTGGKIFIGGYNNLLSTAPDSPTPIDIEIDGGLSVLIKSKADIDIETTAGDITAKTTAGDVTVEATTGEVTVEGATKVTIKSAVEVVVDAPSVKLGGAAAAGGVVTKLTDPLVDNITGAPHIGSTTVMSTS